MPAVVVRGDHGDALSTCSRVGVASGLLIMNTVGGTPFGNAWSRFATPRVTWK